MRKVISLYAFVALLVAASPAFAAKGEVTKRVSCCDYLLVETNKGFALLESYGGNDPDEGDKLVGNFESYGFKQIRNDTADRELKAWVEDYWLSEDDADIELVGVTHRVSVVVPEEFAQHLSPDGAAGWRWESPLFKEKFTMQFSDVQMQRDGKAWEPVKEWRVNEYAGLDSLLDFGVRVQEDNGHPVIELSNDAPGAYLAKDTVFTVDTPIGPIQPLSEATDAGITAVSLGNIGVIQQGQVIALSLSGSGFSPTDIVRVLSDKPTQEFIPEFASQYQLVVYDFLASASPGEWGIEVVKVGGTVSHVATYTVVPAQVAWEPMITRMFTRGLGGPPKVIFAHGELIEFVGSYYDPKPESHGRPLAVKQLFIFNFYGSFNEATGLREVTVLPSPAGPFFRLLSVVVPASELTPGMHNYTFLARGELGGSAVYREFLNFTVRSHREEQPAASRDGSIEPRDDRLLPEYLPQ